MDWNHPQKLKRHFFFRILSEPTCTCDRWDFRFFGWCFGNFLCWNNFLGNFRHLKDISSFMVRLMKSNGLKSSSKIEETFLLQNDIWVNMYLRQVGLPVFWLVPWELSFLGQQRRTGIIPGTLTLELVGGKGVSFVSKSFSGNILHLP